MYDSPRKFLIFEITAQIDEEIIATRYVQCGTINNSLLRRRANA